MWNKKKQTEENFDQRFLNFTKEEFLSLLRDKLSLGEDLVSDEELLTEDKKFLVIDSLDEVEMIMEIEHAISRRFPAEDVEKFKCFQDIWDYILEWQENFKKLQQ